MPKNQFLSYKLDSNIDFSKCCFHTSYLIRKLLLKYVCVKSIDPILWSLSGNDKVYGTNKLKLSCIFESKSLNITGYLAQIFFKHPIFSIFLIPLIFISNWKRAWPFIWSNLTALNSKMLQVH